MRPRPQERQLSNGAGEASIKKLSAALPTLHLTKVKAVLRPIPERDEPGSAEAWADPGEVLSVHHEEVLEVHQQLFGQLGRMPVLAEVVEDLALRGHVSLALADMAPNHFELGFFRDHQWVLQPMLFFGERFRR